MHCCAATHVRTGFKYETSRPNEKIITFMVMNSYYAFGLESNTICSAQILITMF